VNHVAHAQEHPVVCDGGSKEKSALIIMEQHPPHGPGTLMGRPRALSLPALPRLHNTQVGSTFSPTHVKQITCVQRRCLILNYNVITQDESCNVKDYAHNFPTNIIRNQIIKLSNSFHFIYVRIIINMFAIISTRY
jgi:hypothetical protein